MQDEIVEVNALKKRVSGIVTIGIVLFIISIIIIYIVFLRKSTIFQDTFIASFLSHVGSNIASFNLLGAFYIALFGGLFFIFVPMEVYFINALRYNNPLLLFLVFITGILVSYSADYFIGIRISKLAKKSVSPKKFYKIKSLLNKFGRVGIFAASAIPFLPSQQTSFILGVFRYNRTRFFMLTFAGQIVKYLGIILFFSFFT